MTTALFGWPEFHGGAISSASRHISLNSGIEYLQARMRRRFAGRISHELQNLP
jgi:hypothetical protein